MPPPGFPPGPASPPLILWTHCEPRATSSVTAGAWTHIPPPSCPSPRLRLGEGQQVVPSSGNLPMDFGVQAPLPSPLPTAPGDLCPSLSLAQLDHLPRDSGGLVGSPPPRHRRPAGSLLPQDTGSLLLVRTGHRELPAACTCPALRAREGGDRQDPAAQLCASKKGAGQEGEGLLCMLRCCAEKQVLLFVT